MVNIKSICNEYRFMHGVDYVMHLIEVMEIILVQSKGPLLAT